MWSLSKACARSDYMQQERSVNETKILTTLVAVESLLLVFAVGPITA